MADAKQEKTIWVEVGFKNKSTGSDTTYRFGDVYRLAEELYSGSPEIFSGLISLFGLGDEVGEVLPSRRSGSIFLNSSRGTLGANKRIIDLLQDYTLINGMCVLKTFEKQVGILGSSGDVETEFSGRIINISFDKSSQLLTLDVESEPLQKQILQRQITTTRFPDCPESNIGVYVPLIFGTANVKAYQVEEPTQGLNGIDYAYATTVSTTYPTGGVSVFYARDYDGNYVPIQKLASTSTVVLGNDFDGSETAGAYTGNEIKSAIILDLTGETEGYICTQGFIGLATLGTISAGGRMLVELYDDSGDDDGRPGKVIAKQTVNFVDIPGSQTTNNEFKGNFSFDRPVVLGPGRTYYLSYERVNESGTERVFPAVHPTNNENLYFYQEGASLAGSPPSWGVSNVDQRYGGVYATQITDNASDTRNVAFFELRQAAAYAGSPNPALDLDFVVDVNGLKDSSSGTLTGTNNKALSTAVDVARFIINRGNDNLDDSTFTPDTILETNYPRNIDGASSRRQVSTTILAEVFKDSACRLVSRRNGDLALWSYGYQSTTQSTFTESNSEIISISWGDLRTIVNHVNLQYEKKVTSLEIETLQQGRSKNYAKTIEWSNTLAGNDEETNQVEIDAWTDESYQNYGDRVLDDSFESCDWLVEEASAKFLAKYYLTTRNQPPVFIELEVPYWAENFRTLELLDLVNLIHVDFFSPYGTEPIGRAKPFYYSGVALEAFHKGFPLRKAGNYICSIVSRKVSFNLESNEQAKIRFRLMLKNNPMEII